MVEQNSFAKEHKELFDLHPEICENLKDIFFNDNKDKLKKWHKLLSDPLFHPKYDLSLDD